MKSGWYLMLIIFSKLFVILFIISPNTMRTKQYIIAKKPFFMNRSAIKNSPYKKIIGIKKFINDLTNKS